MSGDIDIEEHDLMENPKIRTIFPDLTLLKKEILDPYHEESMQHGDFTSDTFLDPTHRFNNPPSCKTNLKLPNDSIVNIKREIKLEENLTNNQLDYRISDAKISKSAPVFLNKIILGSKPCESNHDKKLDNEVKIFVRDIKNYLMKSDRYCMICQTLFPKIDVFEYHNSVFHKIDKSNKLHNCEVRKKDSIVNKDNPINQCFHCNVLYPSQGLLIDHLYEVLEKKRAGFSENVSANCETIPDDSSEDCKIILNDYGDYKIKSKSYVGRQLKPLKGKSSGQVTIDDGECEKISFDETTCVNIKDCERISLDSRDCETISEETGDSEAVSVNDECSGTKFDEIELLRDINRNEVFQCVICSYYFQQQKYYEAHMIKKHDITIKKFNIVKFNPKCKFCSGLYTGVKQYNAHLHKRHSKMIFDTKPHNVAFTSQNGEGNQKYENSVDNKLKRSKDLISVPKTINSSEKNNDIFTANFMLFKTVLFKCLICDVHFLSPNLATNHIVHNEMLINWKCSICKIFFKKNDEEVHSKQHLYTDLFTIYDLDAKELIKILIKCSKCALFIPKDNFIYHLKDCETNIETWHCSICDITTDSISKGAHKTIHIHGSNTRSDFIIIDDSVITIQAIKATSNDITENITEVDNSITSSKLDDIDLDDDSAEESEIICPITNLEIKDQSTRFQTLKRKIDDTQNYISTRKLKRLRINDSTDVKNDFYSKLNYKTHFQPRLLLNLTYCHFCECFISMCYKLDIHLQRRCVHILKRVCNFCGLTLTAKAIGGHREFHKLNPSLKLQDFTFYDMQTNKTILPPIPRYPKCHNCDMHFINKSEIKSHICCEIQYLLCDICDMKFSDTTLNLHISFHGYYLKSKTSSEKISELEMDSVKFPVEEDEPKHREQNVSNQVMLSQHVELEKKNVEMSNSNYHCDKGTLFMFTCACCSLTVNSYDKLIEHCHLHYDNSYRNIKTKECTQCDLIFEQSFVISHNELHENGVTKESIKIFVFDIFHFGRSNWEWLNHVFKSLSENEIAEIIKDSIYRFEYRIKLEVTQQGLSELTLYQCVKCSIFIDGCDTYKHRAICQGGNKKYPCEYCGIALLSTALRARHIKMHEQANVGIKSYRIVIFNRVKDKTLNEAIARKNNHYVLHQCRMCNGVVDWKLLKSHACNINDSKECNNCGLLIYNEDYDKHVSKHKSLDTFIASNMKVVLFGQNTMENKEKNDRVGSFNGIVYDYTFYKCIKCDVCIQHLRPCSKHFCLIDAAKWKCNKCDLVFDEGKSKGHRAIHNSDIEFTKDTICVIPFDPQETYERLEKELKSKSKTGSFARDKDTEVGIDNIKEKTDILYKCSCGLHYLNEESAKEHVRKKKCQINLKKSTKQTCSKCNLVFNSKTLFTHLLKHHGDKNVKYTFDIISVSEQSVSK